MAGLEVYGVDELHLSPSDPVVIELNRLENQLKDKERELRNTQSEVKALRATELLKEKAVEELSNELKKLDERLQGTENLLEQKTLENKKLSNETKEALAAQFAAEAALRRVHATQKDDDSVPIEAVIAPLESEIKMYKSEITALQEDNKALDRLTKSKEVALVEAEKILKSALERALIVEELQNQNFELNRQIEILQEENRILDKTSRQKVAEVEKLTHTIQELEEAILAAGSSANMIRDYQRQASELNEDKKTLERELARVKVTANRVAAVVANEWKDENEKVMPVRQWLQERRFLQGEIQRLRDKLSVSQRTAKAEAQLKDKVKLRLKTLEEGLKHVSCLSVNITTPPRPQQTETSAPVLGFLSNNAVPRRRSRSTSQPRASLTINKNSSFQQPNLVLGTAYSTVHVQRSNSLKLKYASRENMLRRNLWDPRSKFLDDGGKENTESKTNSDVTATEFAGGEVEDSEETKTESTNDVACQNKGSLGVGRDDSISDFLYDRLQKEVINLRKKCEEQDGSLIAKDEEIKMLRRKIGTLTKSIEIESKKLKRDAAAKRKEMLAKLDENKQKNRNINSSKRAMKHLGACTNSRS